MKLNGRMNSAEHDIDEEQGELPQPAGLKQFYNLPRLKIKNMNDEVRLSQHRQTLQHFSIQNMQFPNNSARLHYSQNMQKRSTIANF